MPTFRLLLLTCCVIHGGARRAFEVTWDDPPQESREVTLDLDGADPEVPMVPRLNAIMRQADQRGNSRSFKRKLQEYLRVMNSPNNTRRNLSSRVRAIYSECTDVPLVLVRSMRSLVADVMDGQYDQVAHNLQANLSGRGANKILRHPWYAARALLSEVRFSAWLQEMQASLRKEFKKCPISGASLRAVSDVEDSTGSSDPHDILMDALRLDDDDADLSRTPSMLLEVDSSTQLFHPKKKHALKFKHKVGSVFPDSWLHVIISRKWLMLIICTAIDVVGMASYIDLLAPGVGRIVAFCWAPVSMFLLEELFDSSRRLTLFNLIEELISVLDLIPSAGLAWYGTYCQGRASVVVRRIFLLPDRTGSRGLF
eukprot:TRINITY_DN1853_c1_g1_i1.p1 TRINITY_DN1853_c1_g1~~TRINITY_DN1853_c1_g1_i1.p1  ORF type:complete len:369 (-),score=29.09 TRINITY_DN1853_c1_g1_i1:191-1297(-)